MAMVTVIFISPVDASYKPLQTIGLAPLRHRFLFIGLFLDCDSGTNARGQAWSRPATCRVSFQ